MQGALAMVSSNGFERDIKVVGSGERVPVTGGVLQCRSSELFYIEYRHN